MPQSSILMTASGHDRPGITSQLTGVLARHPVRLLDIDQAVIRHLLSLSILFETTDASGPETLPTVRAELEAAARGLGLKLELQPLSLKESEDCVAPRSFHYAVTLIAESLGA